MDGRPNRRNNHNHNLYYITTTFCLFDKLSIKLITYLLNFKFRRRSVDSPVTQPSVTQPPVTQPPVTQPPVSQLPVTQTSYSETLQGYIFIHHLHYITATFCLFDELSIKLITYLSKFSYVIRNRGTCRIQH